MEHLSADWCISSDLSPTQNILMKSKLPAVAESAFDRFRDVTQDAPPCYTCAASVSTFPLGVCGLAIETPSRGEGHFLGAESAFLRGCLTLVNNIPALGNTAKEQKKKNPN